MNCFWCGKVTEHPVCMWCAIRYVWRLLKSLVNQKLEGKKP